MAASGRLAALNIERLEDDKDLAHRAKLRRDHHRRRTQWLVTAAYLAKSSKKVLVLERRPMIGGIAATEEIFRVSSTRPALTWREYSPVILSPSWSSKSMGWRSYLSILRSSPGIRRKILSLSAPAFGHREAIGRHSRADATKLRV